MELFWMFNGLNVLKVNENKGFHEGFFSKYDQAAVSCGFGHIS